MIYLDTSAVLKLIKPEAESAALQTWLDGQPQVARVSSRLLRIELMRSVMRTDPSRLIRAHHVLALISVLSIDAVADAAEIVGAPVLRSLDAIHLATAQLLQSELTAFVAYDRRLAEAARLLELPVASPGQVSSAS